MSQQNAEGTMLQGYYSAATGMSVAQQNQEILAENLANAPVPGYREQGLAFEEYIKPTAAPTNGKSTTPLHGAKIAHHASSFLPGPVQHTGNPLECAIQGDGFFVLDGPNGPVYTRNGQFRIDADGQLVSHSGYPIRGDNGGLRIPPNAARINIAVDGTVSADTTQIGRISLVSFPDPTKLVRVGTTLFEAPAGVEGQAAVGSIRQGYHESSNVNVVHQMVQMIVGMRQYESAAKAMRSLSDAMQQRINGQM
jgi:flagellar basal-body rod protein FlgF